MTMRAVMILTTNPTKFISANSTSHVIAPFVFLDFQSTHRAKRYSSLITLGSQPHYIGLIAGLILMPLFFTHKTNIGIASWACNFLYFHVFSVNLSVAS